MRLPLLLTLIGLACRFDLRWTALYIRGGARNFMFAIDDIIFARVPIVGDFALGVSKSAWSIF